MNTTDDSGWADRLARARVRMFPTTWQAARALHRLDPQNLPDTKTLHRYWSERWETGMFRPNRTYRELIERLLDSPGLFQDPPTGPPPSTAMMTVRPVHPVVSPVRIPRHTVVGTGHQTGFGWDREVTMAAEESAEHAANSGAQVSERTLEQLHDDVVGLARGYTRRPLPEVFRAARHTRDLAASLTTQTRRPSQLADLYVIAGQSCGLLSTAAFDMGYWDAATRLAEAALTYADTAGHSSLRAWALGMCAFMANWQGRPDDAVHHINTALAIAPPGTPTVRLRAFEARARALLADPDGVTRAIQAAEVASTADQHDDLHDGIGGELGYEPGRLDVSAGTAYIALRDAQAAERHARRALTLYSAMPPEQRAFYAENSARIDLATALVLRGDLAGARDTLVLVFALEPSHRTAGLTGRIGQVRTLLTAETFRNSRAARQLTTDIEFFTTDTAERALPESDL